MRQPDNLPAFCRVHRNGRPLIGVSAPPRRSDLRSALSQTGPICAYHLLIVGMLPVAPNGGDARVGEVLG
jgi:hypothetical protein